MVVKPIEPIEDPLDPTHTVPRHVAQNELLQELHRRGLPHEHRQGKISPQELEAIPMIVGAESPHLDEYVDLVRSAA
jgi:hypothetical protein